MTTRAATKVSPERLAYSRQELSDATGFSVEFIKRAHHAGDLKAKETSPGSRRYRYLADDVQTWLHSLPDG